MTEGAAGTNQNRNWAGEDLPTLLEDIWGLLEQGCQEAGHPLHTPVFGTVRAGVPALRTVVLRGVERASRHLVFHTHEASGKLPQLRAQPICQWLFYSPQEKVQIQARAVASLHQQDAVAEEDWATTGLSSRRCYCTNVDPGTVLDAGPVSGLPPELESRQPTEEESDRLGWPHFVVVRTKIIRLEFLYLRAAGHRRAAWEWEEGQNNPTMGWLAP